MRNKGNFAMFREIVGNRRGSLLTDIGVGLLIFGLFVGGVWAGAPLVKEAYRQSRWDQQLLQIVQNIRREYEGQGTTGAAGTDITSIVQSAGAFPGDMLSTGTPTNPWGGVLTVQAQGTSFAITSAGLTIKACMQNASSNTDKAADIGLTSVKVNATSITAFPVTTPTAQTNCSNTGTGNTVIWTWTLVN